jgi:phosphoribosylformimino-5-aminoimidazole carboxamide ribotide isomerase
MFRPCIDVKFLKVVQLEQGERLALTDERTPTEIAKIYRDDGLEGGHMIDLEGGKNRDVILPALKYHNLQVGGGVRLNNGAEYLDAGATHLIFSSAVFTKNGIDWDGLNEIKKTFGKKHIVLAPDVKNDRHIYVDLWKTKTSIKMNKELLQKLSEYCDEFLIHSIEVEGMEGGIDYSLVDYLSEVQNCKIVYAGGCNDLSDVEKLHSKKLDITIGKAYYTGQISHDDLLVINRKLRD